MPCPEPEDSEFKKLQEIGEKTLRNLKQDLYLFYE